MDIRRSALFVACVAFWSVLAPMISAEEFKAAYACRALVVDPATAVNLARPFALRYRSAPLRVCMRDDTNYVRFTLPA